MDNLQNSDGYGKISETSYNTSYLAICGLQLELLGECYVGISIPELAKIFLEFNIFGRFINVSTGACHWTVS
jgi:hypothetical protein